MANDGPDSKKVLIIGATGVIGQHITEALANAIASFDEVGIFTSPSTLQKKGTLIGEWKNSGVRVHVGDVNSERDIKRAYEGYDTVVSALGRNVILTQIQLIALAEASSTIHTFYPSEFGTDIEYGPSSATEKPNQLKLQVRKYIRDNVKKLKVTYLVTGPYSDLYIGKMGGETNAAGSFDVQAKKAVLLGTGEEKVSLTTMEDVGRLLVAALLTPTSNSERILKVNSFTTTPKEILAEYEKQTGAEWEVSYTSLDKLKELEEQAWERKVPFATVFTLRRIWTEGGTLYDERDNEKIGNPRVESLEDQVRSAVRQQTKPPNDNGPFARIGSAI
ncbi:NAD(P)-binding protein [Aaosphaeria arxii CBS 175.79]|uniref:NAD(P)-binding protein n=1 Tax=Aaosphaeria arxii CBS 175.79 TaxID=1450172 RepID=A0A6A5XEI9_9PLEO|nr:NAD(P)-binding protein [Aaosphaeria arxii CBS 175.79]KAF2011625.1 NAD(P)-binding protein [Aaosphaeria arxii CBS 175.79]